MARNIISAKLDVIFKTMFSTKENEDILRDFLSSLLDIPIDSIKKIEILNSEVLPETPDGKFSRLDLNMLLDDTFTIIEMQISAKPDFRDRTVYYWSKKYSGELKSGDKYTDLKKTISINIVNFNLFDCEEFHSHFKIMEKNRHEVLTDKCAIHFFELKKISKKINKNNRKELWLQLINAESEEELEMLNETNIPTIQKAVMVIRKMSADEKMQEIARLREKALHDEASALGAARDEGRAEREAEIIARLKASGMTDGQIAMILQ